LRLEEGQRNDQYGIEQRGQGDLLPQPLHAPARAQETAQSPAEQQCGQNSNHGQGGVTGKKLAALDEGHFDEEIADSQSTKKDELIETGAVRTAQQAKQIEH